MKTVSYPNLPILQNCKIIIKFPIKFASVVDDFTTPISLKQIPDKVKFQAIVTKIYNFLTIEDLQTRKINKLNYLEIN